MITDRHLLRYWQVEYLNFMKAMYYNSMKTPAGFLFLFNKFFSLSILFTQQGQFFRSASSILGIEGISEIQ